MLAQVVLHAQDGAMIRGQQVQVAAHACADMALACMHPAVKKLEPSATHCEPCTGPMVSWSCSHAQRFVTVRTCGLLEKRSERASVAIAGARNGNAAGF